MITGAIPKTGEFYRLSSLDSSASCTITKGKRTGVNQFEAVAAPVCEDMLPVLSRTRFWREKASGVELTGPGGEELAAFAEADGEGFESYRPRAPFLTLKPLDR